MRTPALVAVVDDDPSIRETTRDLLESAGMRAATFASAEELIAAEIPQSFACVIADMRMPGMTGLALHEHLVASGARVPVILMTAYPEQLARARAIQAGVMAFMAKPFCDDELLGWVDFALGAG